MEKNKTGKYLKYAIGEIALVVLGILIALQINNWNENKKLSRVEIGMLNEIKTSLEIDLEDLVAEQNYLKRNFNSQKIIIEWIDINEPFNDSLSKHLHNVHMSVEFRYQSAPYETLKQLGVNSIKNDSLRKQISLLYDHRYENYTILISNRKTMLSKIYEKSSLYFNEIGMMDKTVIRPLDVVGLRQDNSFLFRLKTLNNFDKLLINLSIPRVIKEINQTKNKIDEEIKNRS
jgi:hypothetical protein